jgi:hypothetical protein
MMIYMECIRRDYLKRRENDIEIPDTGNGFSNEADSTVNKYVFS